MLARLCRLGVPFTLVLSLVPFGAAASPMATPHLQRTAPPATFSLLTDRQPVVSLVGKWRFHPGDNPRWADPGFDDSAWPLLRSDKGWSGQGYEGLSGFAWYRFELRDLPVSAPQAIIPPYIATTYQLFAEGREIGSYGQMPPAHGSILYGALLLFPLPPANAGGTLHIAIRVWHNPLIAGYVAGGTYSAFALAGDPALLKTQLRDLSRSEKAGFVDGFTLSVLESVLGFTVLGLFFSRRSEGEFLWFALLLLCTAVNFVATMAQQVYGLDTEIVDLITGFSLAGSSVAALMFFADVLHARRSRTLRFALFLATLTPLTAPLYMIGLTNVPASGTFEFLMVLPVDLWILSLLVRRSVARDQNARLLLIPAVLFFGLQLANIVIFILFQLHVQRRLTFLGDVQILSEPYRVSLGSLIELVFDLALLAFLIRRFAQSRAREQQYTADLEAARTLQHVLIPEVLPMLPGLTIETAYYPAQEVGGDFFQILPLPPSRPGAPGDTLVVLGDVAGKGLPAAMTVSLLVGALRSLAETTGAPAEILAGLNRRLLGRGTGFTTVLALRLSASGHLRFANAGHLAPYRNGVEIASPPALPLGLDPDATFPEQTLQLAPGDRLTLLTDGVPEAAGPDRELFGFTRTAELSTGSAHAIADAARHFGQTDDITVLSIALQPAIA